MEIYCASYNKSTENRNSSVRNTKEDRLIFYQVDYLCQEKIDFH